MRTASWAFRLSQSKAWISSAENRSLLYVPEGFAHGFQTLRDDTEVFYQMSEFYQPEAGRGFRWDDPRFGIPWPEEVTIVSEKDRALGLFDPASFDG